MSRLAPEFRQKGVAAIAIYLGGLDEARDYMRSNRILSRDWWIASMADEDTLREWIDSVTRS